MRTSASTSERIPMSKLRIPNPNHDRMTRAILAASWPVELLRFCGFEAWCLGFPPASWQSNSLREDVFNHFAMDVRDAKVAALETIRKLLVVDAPAAQNRGIEVVNVDRIFDDIVAVIVGPAIAHTGFDSTTRHPNRVAAPMMIAAV